MAGSFSENGEKANESRLLLNAFAKQFFEQLMNQSLEFENLSSPIDTTNEIQLS